MNINFIEIISKNFYKYAIKSNLILKNRIRLIRGMQKALNSVKNPEDKKKFAKIISEIREDNYDHYLSLSLDSSQVVSYTISSKSKLEDKKRIKTTLGRYLKRNYFTTDFSVPDLVLNDFVNEVLKNVTTEKELNNKIKEYESDDIVDYYRTSSDIADSCMTDESASYTVLYALNPNKVKLINFAGKARALLWTTDDGTKVLDRAYPSGSKEIVLLRQWAEDKGYVLRRNADKLESSGNVELSDGNEHLITLKHNGVFPYLDTFHFGEIIDDETVQLSNYENFGNAIFMKTDGTYKREVCDKCGEIDSGPYHEVNGATYCEDCYRENFEECHKCNDVIRSDEAMYDDMFAYCEGCFYDIYYNCDYCGETDFVEDATSIDEGYTDYSKKYYCEDCRKKLTHECDECSGFFTDKFINKVFDKNNKTKFYCLKHSNNFSKCKECNNYFDYPLKHNTCEKCQPAYYNSNFISS